MQHRLRSQVTGQDNHRIAEDRQSALAVGQPPILQNLQQQIVKIRVCLFYLIKDHHAHWVFFHRLSQDAPFLTPHITGGRPDKPGNTVRLPVFAHIQLDDILLTAKQRFAQCVAQLGLAHSTGPQEQKAPDGAPGIPQPSIAAQDGMDNLLHRLLLSYHTLPQAVFQPLGRKSLSHRKPGHRPRRLLYLPLGQHQPPGCSHSALQHACPVDPQPGRCLIQQVQRLIRQKSCREIPY